MNNIDVKIEKFYCNLLDNEICRTHKNGYGFVKITIVNGDIFHNYLGDPCIIINCNCENT